MDTQGFYNLLPDQVLSSVERLGFITTGELYQLNSYENRVFEVKIEPNSHNLDRVVIKFYRPGRWSEAAILDEHAFLEELKNEGVPVVNPILIDKNKTLSVESGIHFTVFPKFKGKMPDELLKGDFAKIGRTLAMIHNVGSKRKAKNRLNLTVEQYGYLSLDILQDWIAPEVKSRYMEASEKILEYLDLKLKPEAFIRIHGDCHRGNLLNNGTEFFFVDFDDFCNGVEAQDFWMLFPDKTSEGFDEFLSGYEDLRAFDDDWLNLFNPLRGLRIIHYAKWIAQRWEDPSFPRLFPNFLDYTYWVQEVEALERIAWDL